MTCVAQHVVPMTGLYTYRPLRLQPSSIKSLYTAVVKRCAIAPSATEVLVVDAQYPHVEAWRPA